MGLRHVSVTQKLWLGVGAIVLGAVVIVALAGLNSARHQKAHSERDRQLSLRLEQAAQWSALTQVNVVRTMAQVLGSDAQDERDFAAQYQQTAAQVDTLAQALQGGAEAGGDGALLAQLQRQRQDLQALREQALRLKADGRPEQARALARGQYRQAAAAYLQGLQALEQQLAQGLERMRAEMGAARQGVVRGAALNMALLLLGVAVGAYLLINGIRRALEQANGVARQIAEGDLRVQAPQQQRHDEFGRLLASMRGMSDALGAMIGEVRDSGEAIALASTEIAGGNQDLSRRTEETSSRLQQAAGAMQQLTQTVQSTAGSARQAATLAQQATQVAQRGGAVVGSVVEAMSDIHARSQKIADIIQVIDGIAFQTNILALNAAVEAARAGEQGRGFAVVAAEVRQLAQRSAQAAREIKELIQASVSRVADGARLVQDAGSTMGEVVRSIEGVSQVMGQINTSAAEQSDGVAQVHDAVVALDQMTLQNAALVEQGAAAAQSLQEQSAQLRSLVQRFKVGPQAVSALAAAPAAPYAGAARAQPLPAAQAWPALESGRAA